MNAYAQLVALVAHRREEWEGYGPPATEGDRKGAHRDRVTRDRLLFDITIRDGRMGAEARRLCNTVWWE